MSLTSYKAKKNKIVLILSTLHRFSSDVPDQKQKPNCILDYNKYKGGTDTFDQLVSTLSCRRKTNRWPMAVWFNCLDVAALATTIVYNTNHPPIREHQGPGQRRNQLKNLCMQLCKQELDRRFEDLRISNQATIRVAFELLGYKVNDPAEQHGSDQEKKAAEKSKGRCRDCPRSRDRKVRTKCSKCLHHVCGIHSTRVCKHC